MKTIVTAAIVATTLFATTANADVYGIETPLTPRQELVTEAATKAAAAGAVIGYVFGGGWKGAAISAATSATLTFIVNQGWKK